MRYSFGTMRLEELEPNFADAGGDGIFRRDPKTGQLEPVSARKGIGLLFNCPCGRCGLRRYVAFQNPLDGGPPLEDDMPHWTRVGDTFDTITLQPSILAMEPDGCKWHGYIINGEVLAV